MSKYQKSDKPCKNFIVLVDACRQPSRQRSTWGRYRVGANSAREAEEMVRKMIGFGSVKTYFECTERYYQKGIIPVGYGMVFKEYGKYLIEPSHALSPKS